jgi:hypothetical protein
MALHDATVGSTPTVSASVGESANDSEFLARQHRRWAEKWERLIAEVRALDGYAGFLEPKPFGALSRVADSGPVVLVNLDDHRCDALIVSGGRVRLCRLPGLTLGDCVTWANRLLSAFTDRRGLDAGVARANSIQVLFAVLEWLWDTICRPVLTDLGYLDAARTRTAARLPRVWWCPTGPLTMLPLHAAGRYRDPGAGRLCDAAVSSYTPTLTALLRSRDRFPHSAHPQVTVIGMPSTPDTGDLRFPDLPAVPFELCRVAARLPTANVLRSATHGEVDAGAQPLAIPPTTRRVLDSLAHSTWIHLACHAGQNLADPANGALYLADGPLTLSRIAERDLSDAELAFLSACQTAVGGVDLLDEVIHLAAALQLAGYRHVIATQWSISDTHAPDVADDVYANLAPDYPDATRAAVALHQAVSALRDRQPHRPDLWAVYLHVGP